MINGIPRWTRAALVLALGLMVAAAPVASQANPDSVKHRSNCRLVEQILTSGHPEPHRDWALGYVTQCDPELVSGILEHVILEVAHSDGSDVEVAEAFHAAAWFRDRRVLQAELEVAADPSARDDARIQATINLAMFADPSKEPYDGFFNGLDGQGVPVGACFTSRTDPFAGAVVHEPPPEGFHEQIRSVLLGVLSGEDPPDGVAAALICTLSVLPAW